jgi:hypothetical protein
MNKSPSLIPVAIYFWGHSASRIRTPENNLLPGKSGTNIENIIE